MNNLLYGAYDLGRSIEIHGPVHTSKSQGTENFPVLFRAAYGTANQFNLDCLCHVFFLQRSRIRKSRQLPKLQKTTVGTKLSRADRKISLIGIKPEAPADHIHGSSQPALRYEDSLALQELPSPRYGDFETRYTW